jgi:VanZ family protein
MPWNLQRVLFWLSVLAGIFLVLSLLNHVWPVNPNQPLQRVFIGNAVFVCKFGLAIVPYSLIRSGRIKAALAVAAIWIIFALLYGVGVLVLEQPSGFTSVSSWENCFFLACLPTILC